MLIAQTSLASLIVTPERPLNGTHQHLDTANDPREPFAHTRQRYGFKTIGEPTQQRDEAGGFGGELRLDLLGVDVYAALPRFHSTLSCPHRLTLRGESFRKAKAVFIPSERVIDLRRNR